MNSINKKSIYAVVAVYLLAFKIAQPDTDLRGAIGVIALAGDRRWAVAAQHRRAGALHVLNVARVESLHVLDGGLQRAVPRRPDRGHADRAAARRASKSSRNDGVCGTG